MGPPSEVEEIFDAISYCKGSCVIRMLHEWIGQEVRQTVMYNVLIIHCSTVTLSVPQSFQKGLNTYLTTFAYKNASTG